MVVFGAFSAFGEEGDIFSSAWMHHESRRVTRSSSMRIRTSYRKLKIGREVNGNSLEVWGVVEKSPAKGCQHLNL